MPRLQNNPLRAFTEDEHLRLEQLARSQQTAAVVVARAKTLLAVAQGQTFTQAAWAAGRKSGQAVGRLVVRFNLHSLAALETRPGGRPPVIYDAALRHRILEMARRSPDREQDGTATWSLTTLQTVLRREPGLERISTFTILSTLHGAGMTWQRDRTWCETGIARRLRKAGVAVVIDPDTEAKKS